METIMNGDATATESPSCSTPLIEVQGYYQKLTAARARMSWTLSAIVLIIYYGFTYVVAFRPGWLSVRLGSYPVTIGFPIVGGMFLLFWLLTAWYIYYANTYLDPLSKLAAAEVAR
jgi:uncharacterized membrane protein (DUF485 family)